MIGRAWLLALLLVPAALAAPGIESSQQSAQATLFAHFDGRQDFVLNPSLPPDEAMVSQGRGLATHSLSCLPNNNVPALLRGSHHTVYGYVQSGQLGYESGVPRLVNERGIVAPLVLDEAVEPRVVWALETTPVSGAAGTENVPVVLPEVSVRFTIREGDAISKEHIAFDSGRLIAQVETEPAILSPALAGHPSVTYVRGEDKHLYLVETSIPYVDAAPVRADKSFNLRVDVYIASDACDPDGGTIMPDMVRMHSSPGLRPYLQLQAFDLLKITSVAAVPTDDGAHLEAYVATPWGASDVGDVELRIDGQNGTPVQLFDRYGNHFDENGKQWHCHCYDERDALLRAVLSNGTGLHEVQLRVSNQDASAWSMANVSYEIGSHYTQCSQASGKVLCVSEQGPPAREANGVVLLAPLLLGLAWRVRQRF